MRSGELFSVEATFPVNGQKTIIFGVMLELSAPSIVIDCSKQESQAAPANMALETQAKVDIRSSLAKRVSYLSKDENIIPLDTVRTFIKLHRTTAVLEVTTDAATPLPPPLPRQPRKKGARTSSWRSSACRRLFTLRRRALLRTFSKLT